MKNPVPAIKTYFIGTGILAALASSSVGREALGAEPQTDPVHAAHVASGAMPPDAPKGDPALSQQVSQLKAKVAELEATLAKNAPVTPPSETAPAAAAMPAMNAPAAPSASAAPPMIGMTTPAPSAMPAMGGMSPPQGGAANMMGMMEKMMGMMDKMMSMEGGVMPAPSPMAAGDGMGMGVMKKEMGGMMQKMEGMQKKSMQKIPPMGPMSGMEPGKMKMEPMVGMHSMMGMPPAPDMADTAALPGFPGASHFYHIGADDFFLNHDEHIALTVEQRGTLSQVKEKALLAKATTDRKTAQAEQELWQLTASDQPDVSKIEAKLREIEQFRGDERLSFIRAVGEAGKVLTDQQRKSLLGMQPPQSQPMAGMPAMPTK